MSDNETENPIQTLQRRFRSLPTNHNARAEKQRAEIQQHTEEFLANGGQITTLPYLAAPTHPIRYKPRKSRQGGWS